MPGEAFGPSGYLRLSYALGDDDLVEGVSRIQAAARRPRPEIRPLPVPATPSRSACGGCARPTASQAGRRRPRPRHRRAARSSPCSGPNGAGKTTTVEILEGYRDRDAGEVGVLGARPGATATAAGGRGSASCCRARRERRADRRASWSGTSRGSTRDPRDPDEVIAAVGLQRQGVGADAAALRRPAAAARRRARHHRAARAAVPRRADDRLRPRRRGASSGSSCEPLAADGTTILLTTHYLDEAEQLADRVGVIAAGRLLARRHPRPTSAAATPHAAPGALDADGARRTRSVTETPDAARRRARRARRRRGARPRGRCARRSRTLPVMIERTTASEAS